MGLTEQFNAMNIKGKTITMVNQMMLQYVCHFLEEDAIALSSKIADLNAKSEISYRFIKSKYEEDKKWMEQNQKDLKSINDLLGKIQLKAAFFPEGIPVSGGFQAVRFKTFGVSPISPRRSAELFLSQ